MKLLFFVILFIVAIMKTLFDISNYIFDPYERGQLFDDDKNNVVALVTITILLIAMFVFYVLYIQYSDIAITIITAYFLTESCLTKIINKRSANI